MKELERHISVILFADISGYTAMMQQDELESLAKLKKFEETLRQETENFQGEIIKSYGDGSLLLFKSAVNAIRCGISIQKKLQQEPVVPLRIGIHTGEVVRKENDIFGDGVNITSRIESMGIPNSILISSAVYDQIKNRQEFKTSALGKFQFKNVSSEIDLYAISNAGLLVPEVKEMLGKGKKKTAIRFFSPRRVKYFSFLVLLIVLISLAWIFWIDKSLENQPEIVTSSIEKIAVLPLVNLNRNEQLEYFSDGVTQEVIDELAKVHQFRLSAFSSTVIYKNTTKSLKEIAEELDVQLILAGSARILNDSVRLSIELVDPFTNDLIWNGQYNDVLSNAFRFQGEIARQVVKQLDISLSPHERSDMEKIKTENPEAFDLLLKARAAYSDLQKEGFLESIVYLERAIELDPAYAQAYTLLAWVQVLSGMAEIVGDADHGMETVRKAKPLIEKAISLDPENSDNYLVRGALDLFFLNDAEGAVANVERALEMNSWPKVPTRYCICTVISTYAVLGNLDRASEFVSMSKKVDPLNVFVFSDEGTISLLRGNYDQAIFSFRQAVDFLDNPFFNYYLGWVYYHTGDYNNALKYLLRAADKEEYPMGYALAFISNAYYKLGDMDQSEQYRKMLVVRQSSGLPNQIIPLAMVSSARGQVKEAISYLELAYQDKEFGYAWYLNVDPVFNDLRDIPSFIELINKPAFS